MGKAVPCLEAIAKRIPQVDVGIVQNMELQGSADAIRECMRLNVSELTLWRDRYFVKYDMKKKTFSMDVYVITEYAQKHLLPLIPPSYSLTWTAVGLFRIEVEKVADISPPTWELLATGHFSMLSVCARLILAEPPIMRELRANGLYYELSAEAGAHLSITFVSGIHAMSLDAFQLLETVACKLQSLTITSGVNSPQVFAVLQRSQFPRLRALDVSGLRCAEGQMLRWVASLPKLSRLQLTSVSLEKKEQVEELLARGWECLTVSVRAALLPEVAAPLFHACKEVTVVGQFSKCGGAITVPEHSVGLNCFATSPLFSEVHCSHLQIPASAAGPSCQLLRGFLQKCRRPLEKLTILKASAVTVIGLLAVVREGLLDWLGVLLIDVDPEESLPESGEDWVVLLDETLLRCTALRTLQLGGLVQCNKNLGKLKMEEIALKRPQLGRLKGLKDVLISPTPGMRDATADTDREQMGKRLRELLTENALTLLALVLGGCDAAVFSTELLTQWLPAMRRLTFLNVSMCRGVKVGTFFKFLASCATSIHTLVFNPPPGTKKKEYRLDDIANGINSQPALRIVRLNIEKLNTLRALCPRENLRIEGR